ncbi:50S ribosomal protein L9 [Candidatus Gracilibacteria bacterium]|nr:50S ribosomal protein L9 [Candidatus Gracilibacteria bacterium]
MPRRKAENKTIDVILLESDKHLGEKYEIVKVKPIYARNILFPKQMAVLADLQNRHNFAGKMKAAEEARKKKATNLEDLFMKIQNDEGIKIIRKANKDNTLYAKVDENDIAEKLKEIYGVEIESHLFRLKKKITQIGTFNVPFMYKDIKKELIVHVEAEVDPKAKKEVEMTVEEKKEEVKKTKEEIKAEKEAERAKKKAETIKRLKEKYK